MSGLTRREQVAVVVVVAGWVGLFLWSAASKGWRGVEFFQ